MSKRFFHLFSVFSKNALQIPKTFEIMLSKRTMENRWNFRLAPLDLEHWRDDLLRFPPAPWHLNQPMGFYIVPRSPFCNKWPVPGKNPKAGECIVLSNLPTKRIQKGQDPQLHNAFWQICHAGFGPLFGRRTLVFGQTWWSCHTEMFSSNQSLWVHVTSLLLKDTFKKSIPLLNL